MKFIEVKHFSLKHSIECGQFFRYKKLNNFYYIHYRNLLFKVKQENNKLYYEFSKHKKNFNEKEFLINFFRLNDNLKIIEKQISEDKHIKKAVKKYQGLRLIKQDPWECTISYICSSASNIPKIQKNLELLSKHFGKPIKLDIYNGFTFPEPGAINNLNKIKNSKTGFRAKFILEANRNLKDVHKLKSLDYKEAKVQLTKNKGIGNKIADCICLFSLEKDEAFPVDTWILKAIKKLYLNPKATNKQVEQFIKKHFSKHQGYAQQYLYHFIRNE
jgi:N-glycosylase/DNA lyase